MKPRRVRSMTVAPSVRRNVAVTPIADCERVCPRCGSPKTVHGYIEQELMWTDFSTITATSNRHMTRRCIDEVNHGSWVDLDCSS